MTRRWHLHQRLVHVVPAEVLLTPDTFDQEISLTPRLIARVERAGVLAQPTALAPNLCGPPRPPGRPLTQLTAARERTPEGPARSVGWLRVILAHVPLHPRSDRITS